MLLSAPVFAATGISDFRIAVGTVAANPGETVDVSVSFSHNPGIAAFSLKLNYDPAALTPISVAQGTALRIGSITSNLQGESDLSKTGFVSAVWVNPSDFTGDGTVYTVKFRIHESASGDIPVTLSYDIGGIVNQNYEDVEAEIENGSISINPASGTHVPAPPDNTAPPADPNRQDTSFGGASGLAGDAAAGTQGEPSAVVPPQDAANPNAAGWDNPFRDVSDSDWFYDSVKYVCENKWMNGMSEDAFAPQTPVSRAMFATILHRLAKAPAAGASNPFPDVAAGQWYTDAVIWANENGIVLGYGDRFGVNDSITREQIAAILYRYASSKGAGGMDLTAELARYSDFDSISDWAVDAMNWAVAKRIVAGRSATELIPGGLASRAEVAEILRRFAQDLS
ncbi:MAG: S-layer homology domain-containing protein [Clostridiales Family XIII bacterium]|nr:S-layer homology domain-containing protein [Clostridiales Family XIII bacterium]